MTENQSFPEHFGFWCAPAPFFLLLSEKKWVNDINADILLAEKYDRIVVRQQ